MFKSKQGGKKKKANPVKMVGSKIVKEEEDETMSEASDATFVIEPGESNSFIISEIDGGSESKSQATSESRSSVVTTGKMKTSYVTTYIDSDGKVTKTVTEQTEQEMPSITKTQYAEDKNKSESKSSFKQSAYEVDKSLNSNQAMIAAESNKNEFHMKDGTNISTITDGSQISDNIRATDRRVSQTKRSSRTEQQSSTSLSESHVSSSNYVSSKVLSQEEARFIKSGKDVEMIGSTLVRDGSDKGDGSITDRDYSLTQKQALTTGGNFSITEQFGESNNVQKESYSVLQEGLNRQEMSATTKINKSDLKGTVDRTISNLKTSEDRNPKHNKKTDIHNTSFDDYVKRSDSSKGGAKLKVKLVGSKLVKDFSEDPDYRIRTIEKDHSRSLLDSDSIQQ